jgi:hypothetical protein
MTSPAEPAGRVARRAARRRRRRRWLIAAALALAVLAAAGTARLLGDDGGTDDPTASRIGAAQGPAQHTLLLVRAPDEPGAALGLTLLAAGPEAGTGAALFLPVGTLVDIPGYGLDRLGSSLQYGGGPLVEAAVENALAVHVDDTVVLTDAAFGAWLDPLGTVRIDVPGRLVGVGPEGESGVRFAAGPQSLDGRRLVEYLGFRRTGQDELATFSRQQQVWDGVLGVIADAEDPRRLARRLARAPQLDPGVSDRRLAELLERLAEAREADGLRQSLLPVEPFGGAGPDGGTTYRLRQPEAQELVEELLRDSMEEQGREPLRVEVLNGVGTPGVGQAVHRRLEGGSFRIVVTDNARSFDFADTRILVYDRARLADARRLRALLGVGTISVSRRPQSVVDLTVVVGADFLELEGRSP